jgi:type III secretion protein J
MMRFVGNYAWPRLFRALLLVLALGGCKADFLTRMEEVDANEVLATLRRAGVDSSKSSSDGGKTWTIQVPDDQFVAATRAMESAGLPRKRYASLGELFKKDGLVSTPKEEQTRFLHGVSEELSETLRSIEGVISARVHIVLPEEDPLTRTVKASSASVFIKHHPDAVIEPLIPAIKNLISKSIEGVRYETVSVTLVPGVSQDMRDHPNNDWMVWVTGLFIGLVVGVGIWIWALRKGLILKWWSKFGRAREARVNGARVDSKGEAV